jgi:hypothetical protein
MPKKKHIQMHEFLTHMMVQPEKAAAYRVNPKSVLAESDLSPAHKKILLSKDPQKLIETVKSEVGPNVRFFGWLC